MQKTTQELAHVYAVLNELGLVKIGFAHNPNKRFKTIEVNSGLKITDSHISPVCFNFAEIEKSLHNQFAAYRKAGEWFDIDFNTVKNAIDSRFLTVDSHELTTPALKTLIPISQTQLGTETVQAVDARELHQWLEVNTPFTIWIDRRITEYGFIDGQDYLTILLDRSDGKAGKPKTDYLISLDMAKELSMVERTAKGKEARQYFIACEKALRNPGQSLNESTKAFIYAAVKQVVTEALQSAQQVKTITQSLEEEVQTLEKEFEEEKVINQVRRFFAEFGFSRFKNIRTIGTPNEEWIARLAGFRETTHDGETTHFYVFPSVFNEEISKGLNPKLVAKICIEQGLLEVYNDGKSSKPKKLPGIKPKRVYFFTNKVLGE